MFRLLKKGINFIRTNPTLLFSLLLIIVIPVLIFLLSSFLAKSFQEHIDLTLQKEAMAVQSVLSPYVFEHYDSPELLQQKIEYLTNQNPDFSQLKVFLPTDDDHFRIIASRFPEEIEEEFSKASLTLAWHKDQAIAFLSKEKGIRFWNVIKPFYNLKGEKVGLISVVLSLEEIDILVARALERAYLFAIIAIVLILILVIHHTRLFQYVNLFNKLCQIDKAKDSFMNMAVHELRSPVVNIKNYISELKQEIHPSLSRDAREDLNRAEISAKRLDTLISDILDVIRIEQGRLSFAPEDILPSKIIAETIEELKGKAASKNLEIKFVKNGKEGGRIRVNPNRFQEIVYNLIDNAIKYTKKGEIKVSTKEDSRREKFYIIIEDTGMGVSAEEQGHLFERFYRVRNRETADIEGTGLGLWIVKRLCQKMKGVILVESIKGVGSNSY